MGNSTSAPIHVMTEQEKRNKLAVDFDEARREAIKAGLEEKRLEKMFDDLFISNSASALEYVRFTPPFGVREQVGSAKPDGTGQKYITALKELNKASLVRMYAWQKRNALEDKMNSI